MVFETHKQGTIISMKHWAHWFRSVERSGVVPRWIFPVLLLWLCILSFGVLVPWMGLYADDWPFVYVYDAAGFRGVMAFISWVRPFAAPLFALATALTGKSFWIAHLLLLCLRWLDAILFFLFLRELFPRQKRLPAIAALLFAVFPAFKQQPLAVEYFPHFIVLGMYLLSANLMVKAVRDKRRNHLFQALSWFLSLGMFSVEYFFGQELMRPVILYIALRRQGLSGRSLLRSLVLRWLPFLIVILGFLYWRVFIQGFPTYQPELVTGLSESAWTRLGGLSVRILRDVFTVGAGTWVQVFNFPAGGRTLLFYLAIVVGAFLPALIFLLSFGRGDELEHPIKAGALGMGLGLLSMLVAGWPFWITGLPLQLTFPWDRTTLAFILGASLFLAGLVHILPWRKLQAVILAVMISLSVGLHFQNANLFRKEWNIFTQFYWQLAWRAPGLQQGTSIVMDYLPFNYHTDKFLVPVLNYTYTAGEKPLVLPYSLDEFHKLWGKSIPPTEMAAPQGWVYGTLRFQSDTRHLLMAAYEPPGCLRILTPESAGESMMSDDFRSQLHLSNTSLILPDKQPPARAPGFLGPEPEHTWCTYFEKADLARQEGDWKQAVALYEEAATQGYTFAHPAELLVFIESFARLGNTDKAAELSRMAMEDVFFRPAVCGLWRRLEDGETPSVNQAGAIFKALECRR